MPLTCYHASQELLVFATPETIQRANRLSGRWLLVIFPNDQPSNYQRTRLCQWFEFDDYRCLVLTIRQGSDQLKSYVKYKIRFKQLK